METNWNQLIERYLENELSEEGRSAFEAELASNASLREELDLHQTVREGAVRSTQRLELLAIGASYHRTVRLKKLALGSGVAVAVAAAVTGAVLFLGKGEQSVSIAMNKSIELEKLEVKEPESINDSVSSKIESDDHFVINLPWNIAYDMNSLYGVYHMPDIGLWNVGGIVDSVTETSSDQKIKESLYDTIIKVDYPRKGLKLVKKDRWYGAIDNAGRLVIIPQYDSIGEYNHLRGCQALVMVNAKFGFVDYSGDEVIRTTYDRIVITGYNPRFKKKNNIPGTVGKKPKSKSVRKNQNIMYIDERNISTGYDCDGEINARGLKGKRFKLKNLFRKKRTVQEISKSEPAKSSDIPK